MASALELLSLENITNPGKGALAVAKFAYSRATKKSWEDLYRESFKKAVRDSEDTLKQYARDGKPTFNERAFNAALKQDLELDVSALTFSERVDNAFSERLARAMAHFEVVELPGSQLSPEDYFQLIHNIVRLANLHFKGEILKDDDAFRRALLEETHGATEKADEIIEQLNRQFGLNLPRIEQKIDRVQTGVDELKGGQAQILDSSRKVESDTEDIKRQIEELKEELRKGRTAPSGQSSDQRSPGNTATPSGGTSGRQPQPGRIFKMFISYSHEDKALRDSMEKSFKTLEQQGLISTWNDGLILPGEKWEQKIIENRDTADIVLFLISPDFIASEYIHKYELQPILEREKQGKVYVIVVLLRPTFLRGSELEQFETLPVDNKKRPKAVTEWSNRDRAFQNVTEGIHRVITELRKNPR